MNLTTLTAAALRQMVQLLEEKEALQAQIGKIDQELSAFEGGSAKPAPQPVARPVVQAVAPAVAKSPKPRGKKQGQRGAVKEAIIGLVKSAGKRGITVREIAAELNVDAHRVYTWFHSTGTTVKEIEKTGPAQYRWVG